MGTIFSGLKAVIHEDLVSFHVPGHKGGRLLEEYLKEAGLTLEKLDLTEIPGTDNLHDAEGIILEAQKRAAGVYGVQRSYFLVNGTTCGIEAMLMSALNPKDKVLVARDCHKSVTSGIIMGDLVPVYISPEIDEASGLNLGIDAERLETILQEDEAIKAVVVTYPTYNGVCCDMARISEIVRKYQKLLLVDEAHGAHFVMNDRFPKSSVCFGADVVVQSTHKSLPALTQSSLLHLNSSAVDGERLGFMLSMIQSSSPSYLLMTSLDIAMAIVENRGKALSDRLLDEITHFTEKLERDTAFKVIGRQLTDKKGVSDFDVSKININPLGEGFTGFEIEEVLRRDFGIQMEFSTESNCLFIASICNTREDFDKLYEALKTLSGTRCCPLEKMDVPYMNHMPELVVSPREAVYSTCEVMNIEQAIGEVSGDYVIPYPPGVPLIVPGERIDESIVGFIAELKAKDVNMIGMHDLDNNLIKVIR